MSDLLAFLRARLDDLERANGAGDEPVSWCDRGNGIHFDHEFIVALVESQRALIAEIFQHAARVDGEWGCCHSAEEIRDGDCWDTGPNQLEGLRHMAWAFRHHPDYRQEWKPENV